MPEHPRVGPVPRAAASRYDQGEALLPAVVARGEGRLADDIIAAAGRHGIPTHQSADLVELLTRLPAESTMPPELYLAIAETLAFLLRTADAALEEERDRAGR